MLAPLRRPLNWLAPISVDPLQANSNAQADQAGRATPATRTAKAAAANAGTAKAAAANAGTAKAAAAAEATATATAVKAAATPAAPVGQLGLVDHARSSLWRRSRVCDPG
jgi:activator of HSP90 ATPase